MKRALVCLGDVVVKEYFTFKNEYFGLFWRTFESLLSSRSIRTSGDISLLPTHLRRRATGSDRFVGNMNKQVGIVTAIRSDLRQKYGIGVLFCNYT